VTPGVLTALDDPEVKREWIDEIGIGRNPIKLGPFHFRSQAPGYGGQHHFQLGIIAARFMVITGKHGRSTNGAVAEECVMEVDHSQWIEIRLPFTMLHPIPVGIKICGITVRSAQTSLQQFQALR
jgi:hypothetical protein